MFDHRTRRELQKLSKAELVEMVLRQRARIEELQMMLRRLAMQESKQQDLESHLCRSGALVVTQPEVVQATRQALRHLDDLLYLDQSELRSLAARARGAELSGAHLQQLLYRAIETVKPSTHPPSPPRQQHRYAILCSTYLEKRNAPDVACLLAISERQYYRELKVAIQMVAEAVLDELEVEAARIGQRLAGDENAARPFETVSGKFVR